MTNVDLLKKLELMNDEISLKELQGYVNDMIDVRGFQDETAQDIMLLLTEEVGELARAIRKTTNMKTDTNKKYDIDIEGEIVDVFNYLLSMCRVLNIDLLTAFKNKEKVNCNRTWK